MAGETDLARLLADPAPTLDPQRYVFCATDLTPEECLALDPVAMVRESEALTVVIEQAVAQAAGLSEGPAFRRIILNVHSSLEAVGLIAALTTRLADAGISVNPVAGCYHDHLFVPEVHAERAMALLGSAEDDGRSV